MSILDLQGLKGPDKGRKPSPGSRTSQGCGGHFASNLSILCDFP
jgi:hypothetical protein